MKRKIEYSKFIILVIFFIIILSKCESKEEYSKHDKKKEKEFTTSSQIETINYKDETSNEEIDVTNEDDYNDLLKFSSQYRYKNSFETISIEFEKIELINEYKGIKPNQEAFLIFHMKYSAPSKRNTTIINLPSIITGPDVSYIKLVGDNEEKIFNEYVSINNFGFSVDSYKKGELKYDLATLINIDYDYIEEPEPNKNNYVSSIGIDYVTTSNDGYNDLKRALIFDVKIEDALNPENYLIYNPKSKPGEEKDHPKEKIYFSNYVINNTK